MRLATLLGPDLKALQADPEALRDAFREFHPEDVAELLDDLPEKDVAELLKALPTEMAADFLERLPVEKQHDIVELLEDRDAVELLTEMDPDDRADFIEELEDHEQKALLEKLGEADPELVEETQELLRYDPYTAGGLMTTEYVGLAPETKVWEAIEEVRRHAREGEAETVYYIYVVGYGDKLLGVVSLRDLILSEASQAIADIMTEKVVKVESTTEQEEVARVIARYDLPVIPVVDEHEVLLGVVTVDDVVDVVIEEATEDAQRMGGMVPLDESYFATGFFELVWKRGIWLVVLFFGQFLTANVMESNEAALSTMVELAIFIPLIISTGGNAGSQSSTLIIRALSIGEAEPRDWYRILGREVLMGVALGVMVAGIGFLRAYFAGDRVEPLELGLTVGVSIVAVVITATVVGSMVPLLMRRVGLDPAVSSTPFIASLVDVLGLLVYFAVARAIVGSFVG
ncbi:MAG: magnesium transporter [Sandaracinus sp.]|nr:magnesium transporter [Sandaracinus sp.]MCB9624399.1 magnesium transporter [Sandaracinus sp.]